MRKPLLFTLAAIFYSGGLGLISQGASAPTWIQTSAPVVPSANYESVACSADGATVIAVQQSHLISNGAVYTSIDAGLTWATNGLVGTELNVAGCSADGTTLIVMSRYTNVFSSTNGGVTWRSNNVPGTRWNSVAGSADGSKWVASASANEGDTVIYTSQDSGLTWSANSTPLNYWIQTASSADGRVLVASSFHSGAVVSTNGGTNWQPAIAPTAVACACSADGRRIILTGNNYNSVSTNSGLTWTDQPLFFRISGIAASADGRKLLGFYDGFPGAVFTSEDSGFTWNTNGTPELNWRSVASSADGHRQYASGGGGVYTLVTTPEPRMEIFRSENDLLLSWTISSQPFVLQECVDLTTNVWLNVGPPPQYNWSLLRRELLLTGPRRNRFYKLTNSGISSN